MMHIPTIALVDTNADPAIIDYPIPANDDAVGSIKLIISYIIDAWIEGRKEAAEIMKNEELRIKKEAEKVAKQSEKQAKAENKKPATTGTKVPKAKAKTQKSKAQVKSKKS